MDQAGNIGDAASLTLIVDNGPPSVSITERWWIWESGQLKVEPNHFPIASARVTISDLQNRWPAVEIKFDPEKTSDSVSWNRRFADGTIAPSGEYRVAAVACDIHDLCGNDTGLIEIPIAATSTVTLSPSPTATSTPPARVIFTVTQTPVTPVSMLFTPLPKTSPKPPQSLPFWQLLGLLGLFLVISSVSVIDPRPVALHQLEEIFKQISSQNTLDTSKDDN
jgi:hypothetical protein